MDLKLTNSLTKKKDVLNPITPHKISMYICGITPYDYSHLGHGRSYVNFDILYRFLTFQGYSVTYARNFTDIDDKILARAEQNGDPNSYQEVAQKFIDAFHHDMNALNCAPPTHEPRVTHYIPQIISFIDHLIKAKKAYIIEHDVYFDLSTFAPYGKLSGRTGDDLLAGARVDVDTRKKNPGDFALWKGNDQQQFWQSPWGYGRPGWHIECSVMINELFGQTIDIHGGGMDLIFPHHENEITQSEGLHGKPLAHFWLHNAFITINKEKMSKSLGNFITLRNLFEHFDPMVYRYFILQHHYRTPIDFSDNELNAAQTAYKKIVTAFEPFSVQTKIDPNHPIIQALTEALCDDLNTPKVLGLIFEQLPNIKQNPELGGCIKTLLTSVLGLTLQPIKEKTIEITPEIAELIKQREQARQEKNWPLADQLRNQLQELGYVSQDKKSK